MSRNADQDERDCNVVHLCKQSVLRITVHQKNSPTPQHPLLLKVVRKPPILPSLLLPVPRLLVACRPIKEVNISSYPATRVAGLFFSFSCSYIQIRVFRAEILVRSSYA